MGRKEMLVFPMQPTSLFTTLMFAACLLGLLFTIMSRKPKRALRPAQDLRRTIPEYLELRVEPRLAETTRRPKVIRRELQFVNKALESTVEIQRDLMPSLAACQKRVSELERLLESAARCRDGNLEAAD